MTVAGREILDGLKGRDLLTLGDLTPAELSALLEHAAEMKAERRHGHLARGSLAGKSVALIFFKPSTRTRVSLEVAVTELGGSPLYLHAGDLQLGRGESIADTARVLSRYVHGIVVRTFAQEEIEELARYAGVPVVNGLTDRYHPLQVLADLLALRERFGSLRGLRLAYVGDGNNMAHSLMIGGALAGMEVRVATPERYPVDPEVARSAEAIARETGGAVSVGHDPEAAVRGVLGVYTDTWVSMGQEAEREERLAAFAGFQVNEALLEKADPDAVVMHCLPAHKGEEITEALFESERSIVFEQAENRLHVQKALLDALLG